MLGRFGFSCRKLFILVQFSERFFDRLACIEDGKKILQNYRRWIQLRVLVRIDQTSQNLSMQWFLGDRAFRNETRED
jgi:hypothetical protein